MIKKITSLLLALLVITNISNAQSAGEKKVMAAVERLKEAMISGNRTALEEITDDKLSYGHSSGHIDNKTEFIEKLASGKSDFVTIELKDQAISISGKTAIVRHQLNAATNDNGKPGEVHLLVLLVWQKQKGQWKLLARQAVKQS